MGGCGMIANQTTPPQIPNDVMVTINNFRSMYGLQQWEKPLPHSIYFKEVKGPGKNECNVIQQRFKSCR